jgi:hypothetical protein
MQHAPRFRRPVAAVLVLAVVVGALASRPEAVAAAPGDEPAIEQYSDPFGPLGTGRRTPAWNPFTRDFGVAPPEPLRRRLADIEDGATLQLLLAQLETERARTGGALPAARGAGGGAGSEGEEPGALGSAVGSVVDGGRPAGALLVSGLVALAAGATAAAWARRRRQRAS